MTTASSPDHARSVLAWAASGAMQLTGRADGPALGPPAALVPGLRAVGAVLRNRSGQLGTTCAIDPLQLLGERAAIAGLARHGTASCGEATRLLPTHDGWVAVCLARPADVELVPAWLGIDPVEESDPWAPVAEAIGRRPTAETVDRGVLLGLPVAALPDRRLDAPASTPPLTPLPCVASFVAEAEPTGSLDGLLVADLSSLWAGPLCGSLLAEAGATVVKIESTGRPDGARNGPADFFDLLNGPKRMVALDFTTADGRSLLRKVLARADVVIEASRPRALAQLGVEADTLLRDGPRVWVSITAHGRSPRCRDRVGFGDDAAVAGGLVVEEDGAPRFCADAVADPATGLVAAAACLDALAVGGRWLLDVSMTGVAAHLAGPTLTVPPDTVVAPPRARGVSHRAGALGAHTEELLRTWGLQP